VAVNDWTYEKTVAAPTIIKIEFVKIDGTPASTALTSTTWSETTTNYIGVGYRDGEGKQQSADVVSDRYSFTRSTVAAVNGTFVKWSLENGLGLPSGDANRESYTTYKYELTTDGPRLSKEVTTEYISGFEFAGSLNIEDYAGFFGPPPEEAAPDGSDSGGSESEGSDSEGSESEGSDSPSGGSLVLASRTETEYDEFTGIAGRVYTKTSTTRYQAMGLTQEGQQSASKQLALDVGNGVITGKVFKAMQELTCDGTEVRTTIGRAQLPSRPSGGELLENYIDEPYYNDPLLQDLGFGTFYDSSSRIGSGGSSVGLQFDSASGNYQSVTDSYAMPYAPDATIGTDGSIIDPRAEQAAREYAVMLTGLRMGYANGFNVTTSADRLPSTPFAPLFINAAGLSISTRLNGTSWAFDASGIVASSDLLLCGVAGATTTVSVSWVRLPVPVEGLPVLEPPNESEDPAPASTIAAPEDFDATDPGAIFEDLPANENDAPATSQTVNQVVAPFLLIEPLIGRSRHRALVIEFPYALTSSETLEARSRSTATVETVLPIRVPAVELELDAQAPAVATGVAIRPALVDLELDVVAPLVGSDALVQVPAVELELETGAPVVPRDALLLAAPGIELEVEPAAPEIATGVGIAVPAVDLELDLVEPRAGGNLGERFGLLALLGEDLLDMND
jgi:hypothetical protein